ncbi:hypothetical protein SPSE_0416 [Staphylococcus pseudintermedius ED99]|nr:hypothetical protein SPSE_0416 [Staphylococcus pseudintermedius ED99]
MFLTHALSRHLLISIKMISYLKYVRKNMLLAFLNDIFQNKS